MKKIVVVFLATFGLISFANAGEAPEPCGPAGQLSEDFSKMLGPMHDVLSCVCIRRSQR